MENKNNTLATQRALLKEHFDIELKCFKGLAKGYIIAKNAFLESSAEEISSRTCWRNRWHSDDIKNNHTRWKHKNKMHAKWYF